MAARLPNGGVWSGQRRHLRPPRSRRAGFVRRRRARGAGRTRLGSQRRVRCGGQRPGRLSSVRRARGAADRRAGFGPVRLPPAQAVVLHLVHPAGRPWPNPFCWNRDSGKALWADWSPGYEPEQDISVLRRVRRPPNTIGGVLGPYRAVFNPDFVDHDAVAEATATFEHTTCSDLLPARLPRRRDRCGASRRRRRPT